MPGALRAGMDEISQLEGVVGGQAAGPCTVTNNMDVPLAVLEGKQKSPFTLHPGQSGTVSPGGFSAISVHPLGGLASAKCDGGQWFSATQAAWPDWKKNPKL